MPQVALHSTLLVPAPKFAGNDCRWIDTFYGQDSNGNLDTVDVIIFNAETKEDIKPLLKQILSKMKATTPQTEILLHNIKYVENTLNAIGVTGREHPAPKELLIALSAAAGQYFSADKVIYISGVVNARN